jgi:hypothetical protein
LAAGQFGKRGRFQAIEITLAICGNFAGRLAVLSYEAPACKKHSDARRIADLSSVR